MKIRNIIGLVVIVGLLLVGVVYASGPHGQYGMNACQNIDVEKVKKFQSDTLSLRDDLITKRLELRNECMKSEPDTNRIATLKKEIGELRTQIREVADKYEVPMCCMKWRDRKTSAKPNGTE